MPSHRQTPADQLYQQGIEHFNRANWQGAIDTFTELQVISNEFPNVDTFLADAQLKLQFEGALQPVALAPPRRSMLMPVLAMLALLVTIGGYATYYFTSTTPETVVAVAPTSTPLPPTATPAPTTVPTTVPNVVPTAAALLPATVVVTAADDATFINTPANIEIILDASGSMLARVPNSDKQRWEVAQEALNTLIDSEAISPQSYVVFRTYGRNRGNDCTDVEVPQSLSRYNADALRSVVSSIKPAVGGMTPLAASLRAANEDLQAAEGSTAIILVTDGLESCNGDPVAEAANFVAGADQRKVHVVGFAIDQQEAQDKLKQIADAGQGLYFNATDSKQLAEALRQTIILSYHIHNSDGDVVASGKVGGAPTQLPPGTYTIQINTNPAIEKEFVVEHGGETVVSLRQGFGGLLADIQTASE